MFIIEVTNLSISQILSNDAGNKQEGAAEIKLLRRMMASEVYNQFIMTLDMILRSRTTLREGCRLSARLEGVASQYRYFAQDAQTRRRK